MIFRDHRGAFQFDFFKVEDSEIVLQNNFDTEDDNEGTARENREKRQLIRGIMNEPLSEFTQSDMNAVKDEFVSYLEQGWGSIASKKDMPDFVCHVRSENLVYGKIGGYFSNYYPDDDAFSEALSAYRFVLSQSLS